MARGGAAFQGLKAAWWPDSGADGTRRLRWGEAHFWAAQPWGCCERRPL